jgi:hypothetical protein
MRRILAALDGGEADQSALETATRIRELTGSNVMTMHAVEDRPLTAVGGVPIHDEGLVSVHGSAKHLLSKAIEAPEVLLGQLGTRTGRTRPGPIGRTARFWNARRRRWWSSRPIW